VDIGFGQGFAPDPTGAAYSTPQTTSWWEVGLLPSPQEPHPASALLCRSQHLPTINPSYGLGERDGEVRCSQPTAVKAR